MKTYDRRTFLKQSAMLTAALAAGRVFPHSVIGSPLATKQQGRDHPFFAQAKDHPPPEVIAHRGGNLEWPGETMFAMRRAVKAGADVLEMDVYRAQNGTANGELVLMHDINVRNTTGSECGKKCSINEFTVAELQKLNAAHEWSNDGGKSHPYQGETDLTAEVQNDLRVPTLEEVFKEFPDTRMVIEMKKAPAEFSPVERLCELIQEHGMENKVLVASFHEPFMTAFRQKLPKVATSITVSLGEAKKLFDIFLGLEKSSAADAPGRPDAIQIPYQLVLPSVVQKAKKGNIVIHAWTVNTDAAMNRMKNRGVDGIITDKPTRLLTLLGRAKTA
jgi:glycerophosphoryl diester phosphodiesterase